MKISIVERNGHMYAYRSTSHREPGRKNPVSDREYLGVVDPQTGEIIPKRTSVAAVDLPDGRFAMKDYGDVLLVRDIMEEVGLLDAIRSSVPGSFGDVAAMIASQVLSPSGIERVPQTFESSFVREMFAQKTSSAIRRPSRMMGGVPSNAVEYLESRMGDEEIKCVYVTKVRVVETPLVTSRSRFGMPRLQPNYQYVAMGITQQGRIVAYGCTQPLGSDIQSFLQGLSGTVNESALVAISKTLESPGVLAGMMTLDRRFSVICSNGTPFIAGEVLAVRESDDVGEAAYNGVPYRVRKRKVGLHLTNAGWEYVSETSPVFRDCDLVCNLFLCTDPWIREHDVEILRKQIRKGVSELNDMHLIEGSDVREAAGWLYDLVDVRKSKDGLLIFSQVRSRVNNVLDTLGTFAVMSSEDDFDGMREELFHVKVAERATTDFLKDAGVNWVMKPSNLDDSWFRVFQFMALSVRAEIQRRLFDVGMAGVDVDDVLEDLSTYRVLVTDTGIIRGRKSDRVFELLSLFGVED